MTSIFRIESLENSLIKMGGNDFWYNETSKSQFVHVERSKV